MLIIAYMFCVATAPLVSSDKINLESIDNKVVADYSGTQEAMEATKKFLSEQNNAARNLLFGTISIIPYAGYFGSMIPIMLSSFDGLKEITAGHDRDMA